MGVETRDTKCGGGGGGVLSASGKDKYIISASGPIQKAGRGACLAEEGDVP